jgi:hypothetical protein
VRTIAGASITQALADAQAAMLAEEAPFLAEVWELAAGAHALVGPISIGDSRRSLTLVGVEGSSLTVSAGPLTILGASAKLERVAIVATVTPSAVPAVAVHADAIDLANVVLVGGALEIVGKQIALSSILVEGTSAEASVSVQGDVVSVLGLEVRCAGPAATGARVAVSIAASKQASASDLRVSGLSATSVVGARIVAPSVRLAGVSIDALTATGAAPGTFDAIGLEVSALHELDATSLHIKSVQGDGAIGVNAVCAGHRDGARDGAAYVVDLDVTQVSGVSVAVGARLLSGARARVRGFTVNDVRGARAAGLFVLGVLGVEAEVGSASRVLASSGDAVGVRVLGGLEGEVVARDVAVEAIGRPAAAAPGELADWQAWALDARAALLAVIDVATITLPADPGGAAVTGLHVAASLSPFDPAALTAEPPAVRVDGASVRRVGGEALRVEGDLRSAVVRRALLWAAASAGRIASEVVLVAELTMHVVGRGLALDHGDARLYNSIATRIAIGPSFTVDSSAERPDLAAYFTDVARPDEDHRSKLLGALPYRAPGALAFDPSWAQGVVPAFEVVDLALDASTDLHALAVRVPGDSRLESAPLPFVGALEPLRSGPVDARDPEQRPRPPRGGKTPPSPLANYTARDAPAFLAMMTDRVRALAPTWDLGVPADFTSVLIELLSERLDQLAYAQERALGEGYLDDAQRRRSVEDLARVLDCQPDPGLSATAMLRFRLDAKAAAPGATFHVGAGTLIGTRSTEEASILFATEAPLEVIPELDLLRLVEDLSIGATSARLAGISDHPAIERALHGRWLLFVGDGDPHHPGHVVRITSVERAADYVVVRWDPRRASPLAFSAPLSESAPLASASTAPLAAVYGNVVPAHHGVPIVRLDDKSSLLARYRSLLTMAIEGGVSREVRLPLAPVSVRALGYPRPDEAARRGEVQLRVAVDGDAWELVDDLSLSNVGDEHVVLRAADDGGSVLRFGDDVNGAALPARTVELQLDLTIGLGKKGNLGAGRLTRLLQLGENGPGDGDVATWLSGTEEGAARDDRLRSLLLVDNPLPAVGGRDPELIEHLRYRAPLNVTDGLSAVTAQDYERLALALPEVAAAVANVIDRGVRPLVRVTVLLRDEDQLDDAERLRRWAVVRKRFEEVRLLGFDVEAVPPRWVPLDLDVLVEAAAHASRGALRDAVIEAVAGQGGLFDPDRIGLGGDVHLSAVYQTILAVLGVEGVKVGRFRRLEQGAPERLKDGWIPIAPEEVAVVRAPDPAIRGLFSVTVTGGLS